MRTVDASLRFIFHREKLGMAVRARRAKGIIGVIGLGIMGGAFAKNLAAAGWRVVGYDISAARRREAQSAGVTIAKNAADVAAQEICADCTR